MRSLTLAKAASRTLLSGVTSRQKLRSVLTCVGSTSTMGETRNDAEGKERRRRVVMTSILVANETDDE